MQRRDGRLLLYTMLRRLRRDASPSRIYAPEGIDSTGTFVLPLWRDWLSAITLPSG